MSATETDVVIEEELARVVDWRRGELERAGYEPGAARLLARRTEVDLHRAIDLVRRGCPPQTAARIFL